MSKRLIKINPKDAFSKLAGSSGREVNAVLKNGKTYFGTIDSISSEFLHLLDTRKHKHQISFSELFEIVYDQESFTSISS